MIKDFPAELSELDNVNAILEENLEAHGCPMKATMQILVAMEEMFVNVCHYAYLDATEEMKKDPLYNQCRITISFEGEVVSITLEDAGTYFDPLEKSEPNINLTAEERQIGGLGIFMVRKSMDEVRYERKDEHNIFTMTKKF